jgi:ATPase subunit of ABC transporter with duplicated ATPase domains
MLALAGRRAEYLARFGFTGDNVLKRRAVLSGGDAAGCTWPS